MPEGLRENAETLAASLAAFSSLCNSSFNCTGLDGSRVSDYFQLLKSTESALLDTLLCVRKTMNELSPVNRLPADVLRSIFVWLSPQPIIGFLPDLHNYGFSARTGFKPSPQMELDRWLRVASVCRHWRDVAISCSSLWSTISIGPIATPSSKVDLQLRYSGSAPIDLHAREDRAPPEMLASSSFDWSTLRLKPIIPRLRSFHFHTLANGASKVLEQLTEPAPLLEHLTLIPFLPSLDNHAHWQHHAFRPTRLSCTLPKIFQDEMPRLHSLTIYQFVSWPENNFCNLTRLCLADQQASVHPSEARSCTFMVDLLSNSPKLEELVLSNTFSLTPDGNSTRLRLAHLRTLIMTCWDSASASLLLFILDLPVTCAIYLRSTNDVPSTLGTLWANSCLPNMADFLRGITRLYLRCHYMRPSYPPDLLACGVGGLYLEAGTFVRRHNPAPPIVNFNAGQPAHPRPTLPISAEHAKLYSNMSINELWIDVTSSTADLMTSERWAELFDSMLGITKLVIAIQELSDIDANDVFPYLNVLCDSEGRASPCLPNLAELHLIYNKNVTPAPLHVLREAKTDRERLGIPIRKLVVGAQPPLELYEEDVLYIHETLGPDVICRIQDLSFNWSPFSERTPYERYWPPQLRGHAPGLRALHT